MKKICNHFKTFIGPDFKLIFEIEYETRKNGVKPKNNLVTLESLENKKCFKLLY